MLKTKANFDIPLVAALHKLLSLGNITQLVILTRYALYGCTQLNHDFLYSDSQLRYCAVYQHSYIRFRTFFSFTSNSLGCVQSITRIIFLKFNLILFYYTQLLRLLPSYFKGFGPNFFPCVLNTLPTVSSYFELIAANLTSADYKGQHLSLCNFFGVFVLGSIFSHQLCVSRHC